MARNTALMLVSFGVETLAGPFKRNGMEKATATR
jgi:hypothetical protein